MREFLQANKLRDPERRGFRQGLAGDAEIESEIRERGGGHKLSPPAY